MLTSAFHRRRASTLVLAPHLLSPLHKKPSSASTGLHTFLVNARKAPRPVPYRPSQSRPYSPTRAPRGVTGTTMEQPPLAPMTPPKPLDTTLPKWQQWLLTSPTVARMRPYTPICMHAGGMCALAGFAMTDVLHLRALNLIGSGLCFIFNITHIPTLKKGAGWNVVFLLVNGVMTVLLVFERNQQIHFSTDELGIFEKHFLPYGVSPRQFRKLLDVAKWVEIPEGTTLAVEGEHSATLRLVVEGQVEALVAHGVTVDSFSMDHDLAYKASWLGETDLLDPTQSKGHLATYVTKSNVRLLEWDDQKLRDLMQKDDELDRCVNRVAAASVVCKIMRFAEETAQQSLEAYTAVLQAVVADSVIDPAEKRLIREYRRKYAINDEAHRAALADVGWTVEEYEDGKKLQAGEVVKAANKLDNTLKRYNTMMEEREIERRQTLADAKPEAKKGPVRPLMRNDTFRELSRRASTDADEEKQN